MYFSSRATLPATETTDALSGRVSLRWCSYFGDTRPQTSVARPSAVRGGLTMTFGYLGYIWAILGCGSLFFIFSTSALVLYAIGRRGRIAGKEPTVTVETLVSKADEPR